MSRFLVVSGGLGDGVASKHFDIQSPVAVAEIKRRQTAIIAEDGSGRFQSREETRRSDCAFLALGMQRRLSKMSSALAAACLVAITQIPATTPDSALID